MTAERMAKLKTFCRIDDICEEDTALLEEMAAAAEAYLAGAGVNKPNEDNPGRLAMYDSIVNHMVLDDYDNRGSQTAGYTLLGNPAFRRKLNQLKLTEPVPGMGTGSQ